MALKGDMYPLPNHLRVLMMMMTTLIFRKSKGSDLEGLCSARIKIWRWLLQCLKTDRCSSPPLRDRQRRLQPGQEFGTRCPLSESLSGPKAVYATDRLTSSERSVQLPSTSRQRQHSSPLTSSERSVPLPSTSRQWQHSKRHIQRPKESPSPERTWPITPPRKRSQSGSKYQDRPLLSPVLSSFQGTMLESDLSPAYSKSPVFSLGSFEDIGMQSIVQNASSMADHPTTSEQPHALTLAPAQPPQPPLVQPPAQPLPLVQPELHAQLDLPAQPLPLVQPEMAGQLMLPAQPFSAALPHGPRRSKKQSKIVKELRRLTRAVNNLNRGLATQLDQTMSRFSLDMHQTMEKISVSIIEAIQKNCKAPSSGATSETLSSDP